MTSVKARHQDLSKRAFFLIFIGAIFPGWALEAPSRRLPPNYMRWCGKPLNPVEYVKGHRAATELGSACKDYVKVANVNPSIIRESSRYCIVLRMCYAVADDYKDKPRVFRQTVIDCIEKFIMAAETTYPGLLASYNYNATFIIAAMKACGTKVVPMELKYALATVVWVNKFITG